MAAALALAACRPMAAGAQSWQQALDYAKLQSRVGSALPTGTGGMLSVVEAATPASVTPPNAYFIDATLAEFTAALDPAGVPLTLIDGSGGAANGISGHATNIVGQNFFGNTGSMAPGANNVTIYETNHWLANVLKYSGQDPPLPQNYRVQNHSWVGSVNSASQDQSVLRRFDYAIDASDMTAVVGVNNNPTPAMLLSHPNLMVHSYNAIAVGRTDGAHSRGATNSLYGAGRYKPDLVALAGSASAATARVSSAAAMLHEAVEGTDAARHARRLLWLGLPGSPERPPRGRPVLRLRGSLGKHGPGVVDHPVVERQGERRRRAGQRVYPARVAAEPRFAAVRFLHQRAAFRKHQHDRQCRAHLSHGRRPRLLHLEGVGGR
ncbi:MAG: hypothetical protein IT424_02540 [Pirellulales bacterium]|nr:hypothetical protein [Pirellulales bacterium]